MCTQAVVALLALCAAMSASSAQGAVPAQFLEEGPFFRFFSRELGERNPDVAIGNPMKGLMPSPPWKQPPYESDIPHSLEFYYFGKCEL